MEEYVELLERRAKAESELAQMSAPLKKAISETNRRILEIRDEIVIAQNGRCPYCNARLRLYSENQMDEDVDTFYKNFDKQKYQINLGIPRSRGGQEVLSNLVAACITCGRKKGTKTHEEYLALSKPALKSA